MGLLSNRKEFTTLLHLALKNENLVAIVRVSSEWYGAVHTWQETTTDGKKISNLILTIFAPGIISLCSNFLIIVILSLLNLK